MEDNIRKIQRPDLDMARWLDEDRFFGARYASKSAMNSTHRIDIPTLGTQSWQDEQVGTRMATTRTASPGQMWLISSNGDHHTDNAPFLRETMSALRALLKGESNGLRAHAARAAGAGNAVDERWGRLWAVAPSAVASFDRLPVRVTPMTLWLQPGAGWAMRPRRRAPVGQLPLPAAGPRGQPSRRGYRVRRGQWTASPAGRACCASPRPRCRAR
nr:hypothetical protein [Delftia acidovorans]